jgi:TonB family protein
MSDFILSQKDTVFFDIPDTVIYKDAFIEWDEYPEFPGGEKGLIKYIIENTNYPRSAINDSIEGKVILRFIIDLDGCPRDFKVVRGLSDDLNNECVRVLKGMPKWKPGTTICKAEKGWYRTVMKVHYTVPFIFSLAQDPALKGIIIYPENSSSFDNYNR